MGQKWLFSEGRIDCPCDNFLHYGTDAISDASLDRSRKLLQKHQHLTSVDLLAGEGLQSADSGLVGQWNWLEEVWRIGPLRMARFS